MNGVNSFVYCISIQFDDGIGAAMSKEKQGRQQLPILFSKGADGARSAPFGICNLFHHSFVLICFYKHLKMQNICC